jgi:hypothetical protein
MVNNYSDVSRTKNIHLLAISDSPSIESLIYDCPKKIPNLNRIANTLMRR